jgi:hypothetical protein
VCGNGIVKLAERKANDPRLKAFLQIKGAVPPGEGRPA